MKMPSVLPESFLRCLDADTRKSLGRAGMTAEEAAAKCEIRNERDLHKVIRGLLALRGIEFVESRMDKRTTQRKGVPDFMFAVCVNEIPIACAYEIKHGDGELSLEQKQMHVRLSTSPNCWRIKVIRSVTEAIEELRALGL